MLYVRVLRQYELIGNVDDARVSAHSVDLVSLTDPTLLLFGSTARSNIFFEIEISVPLWTESGRPTLCVLMNYKCEACGSAFLANDGRILHQLDPHIREPCEVEPKYAEGTFHFNTWISQTILRAS
jgi:hypothetical protein